MVSISIINAMEFTVKSVCPMNSCYSQGYAATLQDGKTIEVTCCMHGLLSGIMRLSVVGDNVEVRGNTKYKNKTAHEWFKHLKSFHEQQHGKD